MTSPNEFRLPTNVQPQRYELTLTPDLDDFTFECVEAVSLDVVEATKTLVLNAAELTVHEASVTLADGASIEASVEVDEETERATVTLAREAPSGSATLHLRFSGVLNDQMRGFYRSTYEAPDGSTRRMATTQFEATDARRAFPCWDEPAVKAVFDVTLVRPGRPRRRLEHAEGVGRTPYGRQADDPVRADAGDVDVPVGVHRGRYSASGGDGVQRHGGGGLDHARQGGTRAVRVGEQRPHPRLHERVFRDRLPIAQDGPYRHPRLCRGRHGELGSDHVPGDGLLFDPGNSAAQARQRISRSSLTRWRTCGSATW